MISMQKLRIIYRFIRKYIIKTVNRVKSNRPNFLGLYFRNLARFVQLTNYTSLTFLTSIFLRRLIHPC